MLLEILEARAAEPSRRVLTKGERRAILDYFTLQPPSPASSPIPPLPDINDNSEGREQLQDGGGKEEGLQGGISTNIEGDASRPAAFRGDGDALGGERVVGLHGGCDPSLGPPLCGGTVGGASDSVRMDRKLV